MVTFNHLKKVTCITEFCIQGTYPPGMNEISGGEKENRVFTTRRPIRKEILKAVLPTERKLSQIKDQSSDRRRAKKVINTVDSRTTQGVRGADTSPCRKSA